MSEQKTLPAVVRIEKAREGSMKELNLPPIKFSVCDGGRSGVPGFEHETNDCSVRALAVALDVPYAKAHALMKAWGRKDRAGAHVDVAYKRMGFVRTHSYSRRRLVDQPTVRRFTSGLPASHPPMIVAVRGHVFAVRDRVIYDTESLDRPRARVLGVYTLVDPFAWERIVT